MKFPENLFKIVTGSYCRICW